MEDKAKELGSAGDALTNWKLPFTEASSLWFPYCIVDTWKYILCIVPKGRMIEGQVNNYLKTLSNDFFLTQLIESCLKNDHWE